jgi:hypothetical protein
LFGDVRGTTGRCTSTIVLVFSDFKKTFWIGFLLLFCAVPTSNRMKNPEPPQFAFPTAQTVLESSTSVAKVDQIAILEILIRRYDILDKADSTILG